MPCTTILVGKKASYDGSTMIARNDDSGAGHYTSKKFVVIHPEEQPRTYKTEISHLTIELPDNPMRYTAVPNAEKGEGVWAASGVNAAQVGMTATETITSNPRVLGADPLVVYQPAEDGKEEVPGGIGEEDLVYIVLPYIKSAREGVKRLGSLLEQYGTYEMNGIAFQDHDEIWWLETIGGHHWMAVKVPDDHYVAMPNQLGIDHFDLEDALGEQKEYMCSADLNPHTKKWDGPDADYTPVSDDIPWMMVPEKKLTVEDVKYVLSSHYQGTPYDPYAAYGDKSWKGAYRSIGVNRTDFLSVIQMRPDHKGDNGILQWIAFASNAFNVLVPFYTDVTTTPEYLSNTTGEVSTDNFYWASRMIAAMADASYKSSIFHIERYQEKVMAKGHALIHQYDALLAGETDEAKQTQLREEANNKIADMLKKETGATLHKVLFELSNQMKNAYSRSDA